MLKVAVLVSGSGSNLQSILDYGQASFKVEMVIGSKEGIYALERAKNKNIPTYVVSKEEYGSEISNKILELTKNRVDLIVLAGYLSILDGDILKEFCNILSKFKDNKFKDKIINIHPSLIPSFCGDKMYGIHIHNAVKACGVRFTGCTVHFVNEKVDGGAIILQEVVPVYFDDTAEDIQKRVLVEEHKLLPKAIDLISKDKIEIIDGRVNILK